MYEAELQMIVRAMREAYLAHGNFSRIRDKAPFEQVTDADEAIEAFLLQRIHSHFPEDAVLAEESAAHTRISGRTWTVDPIDGTANFAKGLPLYAVQCALYDQSEVKMSALWFPVFDECYTAIRGQGAFCNGTKLSVSPTDPQRAVVSFGDFPHQSHKSFDHQHRMMGRLAPRVAKLRMFGSAAVDFAALASGALDATVIFITNPWDLAPGILLASEAGAVICDPQGQPYTDNGSGIVAAASPSLAKLITDCY